LIGFEKKHVFRRTTRIVKTSRNYQAAKCLSFIYDIAWDPMTLVKVKRKWLNNKTIDQLLNQWRPRLFEIICRGYTVRPTTFFQYLILVYSILPNIAIYYKLTLKM
jgi:hypothetical protein